MAYRKLLSVPVFLIWNEQHTRNPESHHYQESPGANASSCWYRRNGCWRSCSNDHSEPDSLQRRGGHLPLNNALTAGHWMDVLTFVMNTPGVSTHTATITARNGAGPEGTSLVTVASGTWTTSGSSTGTVTFYVDLGTASLTAPVTVYVNVT